MSTLNNVLTPEPTPMQNNRSAWSSADSEDLYRVNIWGDAFFGVNEIGHATVRPSHGSESVIDIRKVVQDLREQGANFPLLIRFQDILRSRVVQLNESFQTAISEAGYQNRYMGVYPIKVNQLHEVVEEVLEAGRAYGHGLESGSKTELIATLPHLESDDTPLLCNGYKDALHASAYSHGAASGEKCNSYYGKVWGV